MLRKIKNITGALINLLKDIATIGVAIIALCSLNANSTNTKKSLAYTDKQVKISKNEFAKQQEIAVSKQANNVSAWINDHKSTSVGNLSFIVRTVNSSSQPIYNVFLVVLKRNYSGTKKVSKKYNNQTIARIVNTNNSYKRYLDIIPPKQEDYNFYPNNLQYTTNSDELNYGTIIIFKDINGKFWMRTDDGTLINETKYFKTYQAFLNNLHLTGNLLEKYKGA